MRLFVCHIHVKLFSGKGLVLKEKEYWHLGIDRWLETWPFLVLNCCTNQILAFLSSGTRGVEQSLGGPRGSYSLVTGPGCQDTSPRLLGGEVQLKLLVKRRAGPF